MRSLFLSAVLGLGALGIITAAPSSAEARWWPRRAYVDAYYAPGYYYSPGYTTSYYYSPPDTVYVPSTTTYVPDTYYYSTPGTYYYGTSYPYEGRYWRGGGRWRR